MRSTFSTILFTIICIVSHTTIHGQEICGNGLDDDNNGLIDCEDAACSPFVDNIQNGDFELTKPGCSPGFANFNLEALFWDNAAGTAEFYMDGPTCSFTAQDFLLEPNAVNLLASSGFNYAGYHGLSTDNPGTIIQEVTIQELANPLEKGTEYTLSYDVAQLITSPTLGWEGNDEGVFQVFGIRTGVDKESINYQDCSDIENSTGVDLIGQSDLITDSLTWHEQSNKFTAIEQYDRILFAVCGHIYMGLDNVSINRAVVIGTEPICEDGSTVVKILNLNKKLNWSITGAASFEVMGALNDSVKIIAKDTDIDVTIGVEGFMCDSTITIPVSKYGFSKISNDTTICAGEALNLSASGGVQYDWYKNINGLNTDMGESVTFQSSDLFLGNNTFDVIITDENNCMDTNAVSVEVTSTPTVEAIASELEICAIDLLTLTSQGNAISYSWDSGVTDGVPFLPITTRTYQLTGINTEGCMATDKVTVEVIDRLIPEINIKNNGPVCEGNSITFSIDNSKFIGTDPQFMWFQENVSGDILLSSTSSLIYNNPKNLNGIYLTANSNMNCVESADRLTSSNIASPEFHLLPISTINDDTSICAGETLELSASGGIQYNWYKNTNGLNTNIGESVTFQSSNLFLGNNTFDVIITDENNCMDTNSVSIEVNPTPIIEATASELAICSIDLLTLTGQGNAITYTWSDGVTDGVPFLPVTTKTYQLTGTNAKGCIATDNITIEVFDRFIPKISIKNDGPVCEDGNILFSIDESEFIGTTPQYMWFQKGTPNDILLGSTSSLIYSNSKNLNGIYLTINSNKNCVETADKSVISNIEIPEFLLYPYLEIDPDLILCLGEDSSLNVIDTNSVAEFFNWHKIENNVSTIVSTGTNISLSKLTDAGSYFVTAQNQFCESSSDTTLVTVVDAHIKASVTCPYVFENDKFELSVETNMPEVSWNSNTSDFLSNEFAFIDQIDLSTTYEVRGIKEGCILTDSISVIVLKPFTIPLFFSPNNDNDNDIWMIDDLDAYPVFTLQVLNQWGNTIYEWENSYTPWDGTGNNGNNLPDGTYFYIIQITHKNIDLTPVTGYVTIIK